VFDFQKRREVSTLHIVQSGSGAQPVSYGMGTRSSFLGCNAVGCGGEAGHSPPSSAEVKNGGAIPASPIRVHVLELN
jgi:hypothetical protein